MTIKDIKPYEKNAKQHPKKQIEQIANSIKEFGMNQAIVFDKQGVIIVGHGRYEACKLLGIEPEIKVVDITEEQAKAYRLADNKLNESEWDMGLVIEELKGLGDELVDLTGFDRDLSIGEHYKDGVKNALQESYIVPPFSIWDTKQSYWQSRKRLWIEYIGYSGEGRQDDLLGAGLKMLATMSAEKCGNETALTGTSIFDPVVAELSYRWFCPEKGTVLDPFAGGHVRGAVASLLGYKYMGIDLSEKQINTNQRKTAELGLDAVYIYDNSKNLEKHAIDDVDFVFSCPPYYDLERYNDGEGDLSMLGSYDKFIEDYEDIIKKAVEKLKNNRFAVWVVGDIRDNRGIYRGFVKDTIAAFERAGMGLYNEIILANAIATAPLRAKRPFDSNRKITKVHQNILCFYKGNTKEIKGFYGNLPKVEKMHQNVLVFYKGDTEEIKINYKVVNKDTDFLQVG